MQSSKFKTVALIGITLFTILLGVIAVVTSLSLRQKATVPVAPTAPESKPKAADTNNPTLSNQACVSSFTVAAAEVLVCNSSCDPQADACPNGLICDTTTESCRNAACLDEEDCTCPAVPGEVACESKTVSKGGVILKSTDTVSPGDTLTYTINFDLAQLNDGQTADITTVDKLPDGLTLTNYENICTYSQTQNTLTCTTDETIDSVTYTASIDSNAVGTLSNLATVTETNSEDSQCQVSVNVKQPVLSCNSACTTDSQCPDDLVCDTTSGKCRNQNCVGETDCTCPGATPTPTPAPTPNPTPIPTPLPGCWDACEVDADCSGSLICVDSRCANPSCSAESDCVCNQVVQKELPEAGNFLPTVSILLVALGILTLGAIGILGL